MAFTQEQITRLRGDLDRKHVKQRKQGWGNVSYIESWHAISTANDIFGFDNWSSETTLLTVVASKETTWERWGKVKGQKETVQGHVVSYIAKVRVTVADDDGRLIIREGVGAGHGKDQDLGQAHESAIKEAESDAQKRALRQFGNKFGLALYDKDQANVSDGADDEPAADEQPKVDPVAAMRAAGLKVVHTVQELPSHDPDTGEIPPPIDTIPDGVEVPFEVTKEGSEAIRWQLIKNLRDIEESPKDKGKQEEFAERRKILWERMNPVDQTMVTGEQDRVREFLKNENKPKTKPTVRRKGNSHKGAAA